MSLRCNFISKVAAGTVVTAAACSVFEPPPAATGDGGAGRGGSGSGGTESGPWWPYQRTEDQCESAGLPTENDRPANEDPGEDQKPIYLAVHKYRLASEDKPEMPITPTSWRDIGLDMDKLCTTSASCEGVQQQSCAPRAGTPRDGNQCRDNAIGSLMQIATGSPNQGEYFGMTEPDMNCELRRGGYSVIFKISNYNGTKNDKNVRVDLYTSTGLKTPSTFPCRSPNIEAPLDANWHRRGLWTSTQRWKVMEHSLALNVDPEEQEIPDSKFYDTLAYVRNGYLYAKFPDNTEWWLNGQYTSVPGFRLIVQRPVLIAELTRDPDNNDLWKLDNALMTGVVNPSDMLRSWAEVGYCEQMCTSYALTVSYLNDRRDILIDDRMGPGNTCGDACAPCDGLSWAGDIEARQATVRPEDIEPLESAGPPVLCPEPRHSLAPRQGTPCGAAGAGGTGGGAGASGNGGTGGT